MTRRRLPIIRDWYNGYGWRGEDKVYNPFDILLLFDRREFDAYWFESATPTSWSRRWFVAG